MSPKYSELRKRESESLDAGEKVWKNLKYEYSLDYSSIDHFHLKKNFGKEYHMHNDEETIVNRQYYDSHKTDEYYNKSRTERIKEFIKSKITTAVSIYRHYWLYILVSFACVNYSAIKLSNQLFIFT